MHTLSAWSVAGPLAFALATTSIACSPATDGLGGADAENGPQPGESGDSGEDELGEGAPEDGETDDNPPDQSDDGALQECEDPQGDGDVRIALLSNEMMPGDCSEPAFRGRVAVADVGIYGLFACDCLEDPNCEGEKFELVVTLPDPEWLPKLEVGSCEFFELFSEEVEPGTCRHNRVDISASKHDAPWYSAGSAREDLDHNGLAITPIAGDACTDMCGEWQRRDAMFSVEDAEQLVGWGQVAYLGPYEIVNWRSYVTPNGCGEHGVDLTAWTVH